MRIRQTVTLLALAACAAAAQASARIDVSFNDPGAGYAAWYADLARVTVAAGDAWIAGLRDVSADASLTVSIGFAAIATADGRSTAAAFLRTGGDGIALYEQGAAHELMTGIDVNGGDADITFNLGINGYLQDELWFDPNPALRQAAVPANRTDAVSVLLHEFGHALGFNGWRDGVTGALPGNYQSTFDALVGPLATPAGSALAFDGPQSRDLYGGPLPLTLGRYGHLGSQAPRDGDDLLPDLMNGVVFERGTRYRISALDLGVMADIGLPVMLPVPMLQPLPLMAAVPEPATAALWLAGLCGLAALRWRAGAAAGG